MGSNWFVIAGRPAALRIVLLPRIAARLAVAVSRSVRGGKLRARRAIRIGKRGAPALGPQAAMFETRGKRGQVVAKGSGQVGIRGAHRDVHIAAPVGHPNLDPLLAAVDVELDIARHGRGPRLGFRPQDRLLWFGRRLFGSCRRSRYSQPAG